MLISQKMLRRFWAKVNKNGPVHPRLKTRCWIWVAGVNKHGYGIFAVAGGYEFAHRISWFIQYGAWPRPCCLHHCDLPACVRPDHLFEGTRADNVRDMFAKGRQAYGVSLGEMHGRVKLTDADVVEIRAKHAAGEFSYRMLAKHYGVTKGQIAHIVHNRCRVAQES
jgi:hypothetical protein